MTGTSLQHRFDTSQLDTIIIGRVEPSIYAFSTETVPNYLKVGDTYRPVETRLDEWRKFFPNLRKEYQDSARIDDDTLFRDFAVHTFLTDVRKRYRLQPNDFPNIPHYSKEFFRDASIEDVKDAIQDIHRSAMAKDGRYTFYNTDYLPATRTYDRTEDYKPRPNQEEAINCFRSAIKAGRDNLLLYAVMRFGKSFTSMCCALDAEAKFVIIVSAKADVKEEWKKTVESHVLFADYIFADAESLDRKENLISSTLADGKRIVLFLTLQDLQGEEIKKRHAEVFNKQSDLLIIDETHFGARAEKYGKVIHRQLPNVQGTVLWYAKAAVDNVGNYGSSLRTNYWRYPVFQPVMKHIDHKAPKKVRHAKVILVDGRLVLFWQEPKGKKWSDVAVKYAVYRFAKGEKVNIDDPSKLVCVTPNTFYEIPAARRSGYVYVVTALDRMQNESKGVKVKMKM